MKSYNVFIVYIISLFLGSNILFPQEKSAGFDNGFYIRSADGSFVFRPFGLIHTDLRLNESGTQINTDDTQASTFLVRRLRLGFEGQLYNSIEYDLETNVGGGGAELIFAWMNFGHVPEAQVRVGQFKEPFSYEVLLPEKYLDFIERSIVATVVSPAEDVGVMVHNIGSPVEGIIEYGLGIFNGHGTAVKTDPDKTFEYVGRLALYPFAGSSNVVLKDFRIAGYALYEDNRPAGVDIRPRTPLGFEFLPRIPTQGKRMTLGGDIQFIVGPFSTNMEYISNYEKTLTNQDALIQGWHADFTYVVTGENKVRVMTNGVEIAARIEQLKVDAGIPITLVGYTNVSANPVAVQKNDVTTMTIGFNKYLNFNLKFQVNYQIDWFGNGLLTPSSRDGSVLTSASTSRGKLLARVQLFF